MIVGGISSCQAFMNTTRFSTFPTFPTLPTFARLLTRRIMQEVYWRLGFEIVLPRDRAPEFLKNLK